MKSGVSVLAAVFLTFMLSACAQGGNGPSDGDGNGTPPPGSGSRPSGIEVIEVVSDSGFDLDLFGSSATNLEWDIEIEFNTNDMNAVYNYYVSWLEDLGATVEREDRDSDEIEADFRSDDFDAEISVELDDGRVEFDFDVDVRDGVEFDILQFSGEEFPIYENAEVYDVEWDFNYDHVGASAQDVFNHYDNWLRNNGWTQRDIDDDDDDEFEAEYHREGVWLELEVEADDGVVEVEWEINKARFYGSR